jgi:hypothetical protein
MGQPHCPFFALTNGSKLEPIAARNASHVVQPESKTSAIDSCMLAPRHKFGTSMVALD